MALRFSVEADPTLALTAVKQALLGVAAWQGHGRRRHGSTENAWRRRITTSKNIIRAAKTQVWKHVGGILQLFHQMGPDPVPNEQSD